MSAQRSAQFGGACESPSLQKLMPAHALEEICGRSGPIHSASSPRATLTGVDCGMTVRTACQTDESERPSDPWAGSFTSMIDAPAASAARASPGDRTLTSKLANS